MDIVLGTVTLNVRQVRRLNSLTTADIKGFSLTNNILTAVTLRDLTDQEKSDLLTQVQGLDSITPLPEEVAAINKQSDNTDFQTSVFRNITPQQADDYIVANVTDLASAKLALRKMARAIIYLIRRSDLP